MNYVQNLSQNTKAWWAWHATVYTSICVLIHHSTRTFGQKDVCMGERRRYYEGAEVELGTNARARTYELVRTSFCISARAVIFYHCHKNCNTMKL